MFKALKGFTLIELMIVLAIIAIVAAFAYPSYQNSVRKSRRADARAVLLQAAQFMERFYTENFRYDQNRSGTAVALPANLQQSPSDGGTAYYAIGLDTTTPVAGFTLSADPAGTPQASDSCGILTLTNTGVKGQAAGQTIDDCWR